jgi:hypothetical protein
MISLFIKGLNEGDGKWREKKKAGSKRVSPAGGGMGVLEIS